MDPIVSDALRVALALLFGAAASHKARDLRRFVSIVRDYRLLPESLVVVSAGALLLCEVALSLALLFPAARELAGLGAMAVLVLYSGAIGVNLARGRRQIDCGCGGSSDRPLGPELLLRNGLLIAVGGLVALPLGPRPRVGLDHLTVVLAVGALILIWKAGGQLAANASWEARASVARGRTS